MNRPDFIIPVTYWAGLGGVCISLNDTIAILFGIYVKQGVKLSITEHKLVITPRLDDDTGPRVAMDYIHDKIQKYSGMKIYISKAMTRIHIDAALSQVFSLEAGGSAKLEVFEDRLAVTRYPTLPLVLPRS